MQTAKDFQFQVIHQGFSRTGQARTRTRINITAINYVTIFSTNAGHQRPETGHAKIGQIILYSVQCCWALH